eukprot:13555637-Alexandrium_andersonii.AAC.1
MARPFSSFSCQADSATTTFSFGSTCMAVAIGRSQKALQCSRETKSRHTVRRRAHSASAATGPGGPSIAC